MDLAYLFIPFLQFIEIYITSFWSGGFTTPTAVNQRNENLRNSIFVHYEMTFVTTLTGILDFANLVFQTGIFSQFKLGKKSSWIFQTGESLNFVKYQCADRQEERIQAIATSMVHTKSQIFLEKYCYYFYCPKNVPCSILSFVF